MRYELHNLDGNRERRVRVYDMPIVDPDNYWANVTDVPCPTGCGGKVFWAEAGFVPGYRICGKCLRHWQAGGNAEAPVLLRVGRRSGIPR